MESFAGADLHKRVTQLAVLRDGQAASQFRFANDTRTVDGVLKRFPPGTKVAVETTGSWWWFVEKARDLLRLHPRRRDCCVVAQRGEIHAVRKEQVQTNHEVCARASRTLSRRPIPRAGSPVTCSQSPSYVSTIPILRSP